MQFETTSLPGVVLITPRVFGDSRGYFLETWQRSRFEEHGIGVDFVQDNHSRSTGGILRGLHYQVANTQGKLVRVARGRVFDVAVDVRRSSPHFGRWAGFEISDENQRMLWVPPGFAHGFFVLSDVADFVYKCTDYYNPRAERSIRWDDPDIGIEWPIAAGSKPQLSAKDASAPLFRDAEGLE